MSVFGLLTIFIAEGFIIGQLRNFISQRRIAYAIFSVTLLVGLLALVNLEQLKNEASQSLRLSVWMSYILIAILGGLVLYDYKYPYNRLGDVMRIVNKNTHNLFFILLVIYLALIFYVN